MSKEYRTNPKPISEAPFKDVQEGIVSRLDGLTHEEIFIAAKNVGVNLGCGGCASEFYTGRSEAHDEHCTRGGKIYPSLSIETFVRELLNNPPGLNGVELDGVKISNKHVDHGWKAGLIKVMEFIEERMRRNIQTPQTHEEWTKSLVIVDEATEVSPEMWDAVDKVVKSSPGLASVISTEEGPNWAGQFTADFQSEETFNPSHTSPFTTKGKLIGPSLFSMVCLQDFKEGSATPKKVWVACERPREIIHYDGVDYNYVGVSDGRMFYVREGK